MIGTSAATSGSEEESMEPTMMVNRDMTPAALCGVVRYPNSTAYTAGPNPYLAQGCGCAPAF